MVSDTNLMGGQAPLQELHIPAVVEKGIRLWVKRDDMRHPQISGNKWHKLKYNLQTAINEQKQGILTFGGPFSNHVHATAYACKQSGLESLAIIRGEPVLNDTLKDAKDWGMELRFVSREEYRYKDDKTYLAELTNSYPEFFIVPEGGSNLLALSGCAELSQEILADKNKVNWITVPCGTGGTIAGMSKGIVNSGVSLLGFSVLKAQGYIDEQVRLLLENGGAITADKNWRINEDFHFGGYAKINADLAAFTEMFESETGIPVEPVYSGKMFYGLLSLIKNDFFRAEDTIVAVHTGGLQGKRGMIDRMARLSPKANHQELQKLFR